jgi:hypothetical protein
MYESELFFQPLGEFGTFVDVDVDIAHESYGDVEFHLQRRDDGENTRSIPSCRLSSDQPVQPVLRYQELGKRLSKK